MSNVLYRYDGLRYSTGVDEYGTSHGYRVMLNLTEFKILKETPKGAWIDNFGKKKFVNLHAKKQFACIDQTGALNSFLKRKECQIRILSSRLDTAKEMKLKAESLLHVVDPKPVFVCKIT